MTYRADLDFDKIEDVDEAIERLSAAITDGYSDSVIWWHHQVSLAMELEWLRRRREDLIRAQGGEHG